uniref:DUF1772-domain-containing protein n=1 Tax=Acrobeloides nanus TaxID=290746 RepID=A0A914DHA7_9BILA
MLAGQLALLDATLFTGGALWVTAIEHPTIMKLDDKNLLQAFHRMYPPAAKLQSLYVLTGTAFGAYQYFQSKEPLWLVGSGLLFLVAPYTFLALIPTNNKLIDTPVEKGGVETRRLIENWGCLHSVRTILGALSTATFLYAVLKH